MSLSENEIYNVLDRVFGYTTFRGQQLEVINTVLKGEDALVIMPTGGGKSLCYQIPALLFEGTTIVVSPLIALMNDQVAALVEMGVNAAALHSNLSTQELTSLENLMSSGGIKIVYVSPEKLLSRGFIEKLPSDISLFAIDEAHCVSVWGNDFRPEYVKLKHLKNKFPKVPTLALTATADEATREDIITQLKLRTKEAFLSSFERTNIFLEGSSGSKKIDRISRFLSQREGESGIIYCLSRKGTEKLADKLRSYGYNVKAYHAGMKGDERLKVQEQFQNDEIQIICATIAFGMGIDKPNIRFVIHHNLPKNIEGYYQEIGRAGRDGQPSSALLFYSWADFLMLKRFIDESSASDEFKEVQRAKLDRMWQFSNATNCRTNMILTYFGEYRDEGCGHCDICMNPPTSIDGLTLAQMALSAVARVKGQLNFSLLIDFIRGSFRREMTEAKLNELKTFGVGKSYSFKQWRHYLTQFINMGLLRFDYTDASRVKLTPLSESVLKGEKAIAITEFKEVELSKTKKPKLLNLSKDLDADLLLRLKKWRIEKVSKVRRPAYTILSNKSLEQIAKAKPTDLEQLAQIEGIGEVKLEKYGKQLLDLVSNNN